MITNDLSTIANAFSSEPGHAIERLLDFSKNHGPREFYFKVLILKSEFKAATTDEAKADKLQSVKNLINSYNSHRVDDLPEQNNDQFLAHARTKIFTSGLRKGKIIQCSGVTKNFKSNTFKLSNIDFEIASGEIIGIVGENGNGKTTLLKILSGYLAADSGTLRYPFLGDHSSTNWLLVKKQIAYLPQELKPVPGKVINSIRLNATLHGLTPDENEFEVDYIMTRLGLESYRNSSWSKLSGGFKLRFALARLLVTKPKAMLLDEPLANLDPNSQKSLLNDLYNLSRSMDNPVSIVISSQHLPEVESISDKMLILAKGQRSYFGLTSSLGESRQGNSFELRTMLNRIQLENRLTQLNYNKISYNGMSYVINTPLSVTMEVFMTACLQNQIPVLSINDISNSSQSFLLKK